MKGSDHDFYWGRDVAGRVLLILLLKTARPPKESLPSLRGIEVTVQDLGGTSSAGLILTLNEARNTDLFAHLCRDIVQSASSTRDNNEAVQAALQRPTAGMRFKQGTGRLSPSGSRDCLAVPLPRSTSAALKPGGAARLEGQRERRRTSFWMTLASR